MSDSMFWSKEFQGKCDYLATLNWMKKTDPECYFTVFEWDRKITNDQWSEQLDFIGWHFVKIFFTTKDLANWPAEKVNLILQKGTKTLLFTSFRNEWIRRFISCFDKDAEIGELNLSVYTIHDEYVKDGKTIEAVKKWLAVHHNGEKLKPLLSRDERESMVKIYKDDKGKVIKSDFDTLNAYLKEIALTRKPQEAVRYAPKEQAPVEETKTEFKTPITDNIKAKQEEEYNDDLPF